MLSNKDLFNGMRLIKTVGVEKITEMQKRATEINNSEAEQNDKIKDASMLVMSFLLEAACDAEADIKKLLAGWKNISYADVDKMSANEFVDLIEEFASENTVKELTDFFNRVLGLITKMR